VSARLRCCAMTPHNTQVPAFGIRHVQGASVKGSGFFFGGSLCLLDQGGECN